MSDRLLERLRAALSPEYEVEKELGAGGMGTVFLARDVNLQRHVAVKILRPELATARAAERFLQEARILASLSHPNIVPVHRAGEADGLYYYVMEFVDGDTLRSRLLKDKTLSREEARKLGADLLAALEACHKVKFVHRDIKPANIFLLEDRALLGDFGIARSLEPDAEGFTATNQMPPGTPGYMAPEHRAGDEVTHLTDLWAVGAVLYEALTGLRWTAVDLEPRARWKGVPGPFVRVLKRALADAPSRRWSSAREFRRAIDRNAPVTPPLAWLAAALLLALVVAVYGWFATRDGGGASAARDGSPAGSLLILVDDFATRGSASRELASDVMETLAANLAGPEFLVRRSSEKGASAGGPAIRVGGSIEGRRDSVAIEARGTSQPAIYGRVEGELDNLASLVERLAHRLLNQIWSERNSPLAEWLPGRALPNSPRGLSTFFAAERAFAEARWSDAYRTYLGAEAVDSTCLLCLLRIHDIERWLGLPHDQRRQERLLAHVDSFQPWYQELIRASQMTSRARMDRLAAITRRYPRFFLPWFELGDEVFHRGPLFGRRRAEAEAYLVQAIRLRPDFAPAWEHLALVQIAEDDSAGARVALDRFARASSDDPFTLGLLALSEAGFAWRFYPSESAAALTAQLSELQADNPDLAAAPRMLGAYFDAAEGAVWLGTRFAAGDRAPDLQRSGLLAQMFGYLALGQVSQVRVAGERLKSHPAGHPGLFVQEIEALLLLFDAEPAERAARWPTVRDELERYASDGVADALVHQRALWWLGLLTRGGGEGDLADGYLSSLNALEREPRRLSPLLEAQRQAAQGQVREALEATEAIRELDVEWDVVDPTYRSVLHLLRSEWYTRAGDMEGAVRELRWHENSDLRGRPTGDPQAVDVDWSLGTLGRWRRARALDQAGEHGEEMCDAFRQVRRLWYDGDMRYRARADSARRRMAALRCG